MEYLDQAAFWYAFGAAELTGIILVIWMGYWRGVLHDGFAWEGDSKKQFNWHPFLLTIGLLFFYGNGMMIYRVFRNAQKKTLKVLHAAIMLASFLLMTIALKAVFNSNNYNNYDSNGKKLKKGVYDPLPNMNTLHSWMGIITALLFTMQWVVGFTMFLAPITIAANIKAFYLSIHHWFGLFIFALVCATVLTGVSEEELYRKFDQREDPEGVMMNITSLLVIIFGCLIIFLSVYNKYKRMPLPEEKVPIFNVNKTSDQIKDVTLPKEVK